MAGPFPQRRRLRLVSLWTATACALGPAFGSGLFAVTAVLLDVLSRPGHRPWDERAPDVLEIPYLMFVMGVAVNLMAALPLWGLLAGYAAAGVRFPLLERSRRSVALSCALLSVLCFAGLAPIFWLAGSDLLMGVVTSGPRGIGSFVMLAIFGGLLAPRLAVPALRPGVFSDDAPVGPAQPWPRAVWWALAWTLGLTLASFAVETELIRGCLDSDQDSCFEIVPSRGWPYPYLQRGFEPLALAFDWLLITAAHTPLLALLVRRGRSARAPAPS